MATKIVKFQKPGVICAGTFPTTARQTMTISYASPIPPGWTLGHSSIIPPAGQYLYEAFFEHTPAEPFSQGNQVVHGFFDNRKIIQCNGTDGIYLRTVPGAANSRAYFLLTPL